MSQSFLTLREAAQSCGIQEKYFRKYIFKGGELRAKKVSGRWVISKREFDQWKENRAFRLVKLGIEDYFKAFNFAIKQFYRGGIVVVEWGKTKRREIGEFLFNQICGKLGELAFCRFLRDKFNVETRISFEIEKEVPGQDIFEVNGRLPRIKVSIKTTKMQNFNLWVIEEEIDFSDAYVLCRVDLPSDHLLRAFREHERLYAIRNIIPELTEIEAEVVGFTWKDELKVKGATMRMVGADGKVVQE